MSVTRLRARRCALAPIAGIARLEGRGLPAFVHARHKRASRLSVIRDRGNQGRRLISEELSISLKRSFVEARELQSETVSLEQLLLALLHNPRVADVLLACSVHVGNLHNDLVAIVHHSTLSADGKTSVEPQASPEYERTLQRAIIRVQATRGSGSRYTGLRRATERLLAIFKPAAGRAAVHGTDLLVAVFDETETPAALALRRHGISRYDVTNFIAHGIKPSGATSPSPAQPLPPGRVDVVLVNDDFTPMEFVVKILQEQFMFDLEPAAAIMLKIHRDGRAVCGRFDSAVAARTAAAVRRAAHEEGHPLKCILEPG